ncbi:MAG TPA: hypothetical protein VKD67_07810 [Acidimicrobiales bacterium]|nr:hypothetical protein [Acidimicrobiales bacterium]
MVRGWIDGEDLKVRLLATGDVAGEAVCGSATSAAAQLTAWLSSLDDRRNHPSGDEAEMVE